MSSDKRRVRVPRALMNDLHNRWASIIEADTDTEGFWSDVAKFYGCDSEGLSLEQETVARECIRRGAASLRRKT